nr:MAG TPA: hypothetical protein [Caudoviricetes sp.]
MLSDYPAHIPPDARSIQINPGIADLLLRACAAAGAQASRDADRLQQAGRSIEAAQAASTALEYLIAHDRLLAACGIAEEVAS